MKQGRILNLATIPIIWSDETLLVISKPPGLLSLPDGYDPALPHLKSELCSEFGPLWIVHRLDRDTSGVMVLARSAEAHRIINTQFQERSVRKVYKALVLGNPGWDRKIIEEPLKINAGRRHRTVIDQKKGKHAVTQFLVCERFHQYCLLEAVPQTGRRHQIRVHLAGEGFPIACDSLYGNQREIRRVEIASPGPSGKWEGSPLLQRTALHASSLELLHPFNESRCQFEAALPEDLAHTLDFLRRFDSQHQE
jgi:RluA family pseudouridine synthase